MAGADQHLLSFLVLVAGAAGIPLLAGRLRIPSPVLLVGFGLLVGPQVLGWLHVDEVTGFLGELGLIVLMFLAGMEIDFNGLAARGGRELLWLLAGCLGAFGLAGVACLALELDPIYGLALGASSLGLPLAVLKEVGRLRSPLGQSVILLGSLGEFLTVLGLTLFSLGSRHGFSLELLWALGKLLAVLAVAGAALRSLVALAWWRPQLFAHLVKKEDGSELGVRMTLVLMMAFSMLAWLAGVEAIVGAFVAGAVTAYVLRGKAVLEEKLSAVGHGLLVPVFFTMVGASFEPGLISPDSLLLALELTGLALAVKLLPALVLLRGGLSLRESLAAGMLLAAPLTLVVAISAVALELGAVDGAGRTSLVLLALAAGVVFPIGFHWLGAKDATASGETRAS
ncbi:MAG TPA: cation:proton antiporter [Myxococcota bacterium]|nr:cation:proton antiporter [Myxococcota bacterium]HRY92485.1 cation:proton antiporter [Myxococcota bacterium]